MDSRGNAAQTLMALKSTICKAELAVADVDRGYYRNHAVTLARHPSETDERMMVRLLAPMELQILKTAPVVR